MKYDNILNFSDQVLDYAFELANTLGARAISCELPVDQVEGAQRLGQFADKHKTMIGFHGHLTMTPAIWEKAFSYSKFNGANLDIGHFISGNKTSPVPFLKQYHDRITHVHIKDKTLDDKNVPFGKGDTPVKEVLQLIRDNKWNMQATIEFEIPGPARVRPHDRDRQVDSVLPRRAGATEDVGRSHQLSAVSSQLSVDP